MHAIHAAALLVAALSGTPAHACVVRVEQDLRDVEYADVVVVGRIANYELVLDPVARQRHADLLASPELLPKTREILEDQDRFLTDYARFDILVDEVLRGTTSQKQTVTWDNSTFGEPDAMQAGSFLIALRDPHSPSPPLRGPSGILRDAVPGSLTVLQAPCSRAFIFESTSEEAGLVRQILGPTDK